MSSDIDVIIPTIGTRNLSNTIFKLNSGLVKPKKIIVCYIKKKKLFSILKKNNKNLLFIKAKKKGQIHQRKQAFLKSKNKIILQIDDDVSVKTDTLKYLKKSLLVKGRGHVVGPVYVNKNNKESIHKIKRKFQFLFDFLHYFFCGAKFGYAKSGSLTSILINYGIDNSIKTKSNLVKTDWLPGGCIISHRNDFLTSPNFPFKGKAYCEDIFYSINRTKKNIDHFVCKNAIVEIDLPYSNFYDFFNELKIRYFLIKKFRNDNILKFYIWASFSFFVKLFSISRY